MNVMRILLWMIAMSLGHDIAMGQESPPPADVPEYKKYPQGYRQSAGQAFYELSIAPAMSEEEWLRYATDLNVSESQSKLFLALYEQYREQDWAFRKAEIQALWDRSSAIATAGDLHTNTLTAREFVELMDQRTKMLPRLFGIEDHFFDSLTWYLGEEQKRLLQHVKYRRLRTRWKAQPSVYPGSMFDVFDALDVLKQRDLDLMPNDHLLFEAHLDEYRDKYSSLAKQRFEHGLDVQSKGGLMIAEVHEMASLGESSVPARIEMMERRYKLNEPWVATSKQMLQLNEQCVQRVAELLPAFAATELTKLFNEFTYRPIFPDPADLSHVFDLLRGSNGLDDKHQELLLSSFESWNHERKRINDELMKRYLAWKDRTQVRMGYQHDEYQEYRQSMLKLMRDRLVNSKTAIDTLSEVLGEQGKKNKHLASALAIYEKRRAEFVELLESPQWLGPYE